MLTNLYQKVIYWLYTGLDLLLLIMNKSWLQWSKIDCKWSQLISSCNWLKLNAIDRNERKYIITHFNCCQLITINCNWLEGFLLSSMVLYVWFVMKKLHRRNLAANSCSDVFWHTIQQSIFMMMSVVPNLFQWSLGFFCLTTSGRWWSYYQYQHKNWHFLQLPPLH